MDYVLVFNGKCIIQGDFAYCTEVNRRLMHHLHQTYDQYRMPGTIRHKLPEDTVELPADLKHVRAEIGA